MAMGQTDDMGFEDSVLAGLSANAVTALSTTGVTAQRTGNQFSTAVRVQVPRVLQEKHKQLLQEATLAGESFYYGWGTGKDRVLGPSIGLAMAAARVWGNCAVDLAPMQEAADAWIFTAQFIDLETGFTLARQFRQSKHWSVQGKYDQERKDDMRFQIGQSKAARNVVINALPKWLIDAAVAAAQNGVRKRIEQYVETNGLAKAVDIVLKQLKQHGVSEEAILAKCQVAKVTGLDVEHVVMLRGDLYSLQQGTDRPEALFPTGGELPAAQQATNATTTRGTGPVRSAVNDALDDDAATDSRPVQSEKAKVASEQATTPAAKSKKPRAEASAVTKSTPAPVGPPAEPVPSPIDAVADDVGELATAVAGEQPIASDNSATDVEPQSQPSSGGDVGEGLIDLPNGFRARLKTTRAPAEIDALMKEFDVETTTDEQWKVMTTLAEKRRVELRQAARRGA
jgi:hypothetical protein